MINTNRIYQLIYVAAFATLLVLPGTVLAHARWVLDSVTPPRSTETGLKINPCGGKARTTRSTIFSAGQTIEVKFEETVNHPGHYRIAFSPANDLNFDSYVLEDDIPDITNNGTYTQQITIPADVCSACTLQLIQVMTTSATPGPNDYYYSCSDIQITASGDTTAPGPVTEVSGQAGNGQIGLSWTNPADDFYQVVVLKDTSPILDTPVDGTIYSAGDMINSTQVAYAGNGNSITATALTNNVEYYFKVFVQNPRKNFSGGIETSAVPDATLTGGGGSGGGSSNKSDPDDSGGGALNIFLLMLLVAMKLFTTRKIFIRKA